jgi:hypothetical protein
VIVRLTYFGLLREPSSLEVVSALQTGASRPSPTPRGGDGFRLAAARVQLTSHSEPYARSSIMPGILIQAKSILGLRAERLDA